MENNPDFFLTSAGESENLRTPRSCWAKGRLRNQVSDDIMLIEIDPPLPGQKYGLGDKTIKELLISPRFENSSLFPVREWPCRVFGARILDDSITTTLTIAPGQVEVIAWGIIFRTLDEATVEASSI